MVIILCKIISTTFFLRLLSYNRYNHTTMKIGSFRYKIINILRRLTYKIYLTTCFLCGNISWPPSLIIIICFLYTKSYNISRYYMSKFHSLCIIKGKRVLFEKEKKNFAKHMPYPQISLIENNKSLLINLMARSFFKRKH